MQLQTGTKLTLPLSYFCYQILSILLLTVGALVLFSPIGQQLVASLPWLANPWVPRALLIAGGLLWLRNAAWIIAFGRKRRAALQSPPPVKN